MIKCLAPIFVTSLLLAQEPAPTPAPSGGGGAGGGVNGGGVTSPNPSGGGANTTSPFPGRTTTTPGQNPNDRMQFPEMGPRPIFISGKVMMDDGTAPSEQVVIERVCNGSPRPEGYTDSKGNFSFELGRNQATMVDASYSNNDDNGFGGLGGRAGGSQNRSPGSGPQITERDLMGCEIRATLAGYRSDSISLSGRKTLDNPSIGTLILHRRANVEGFTSSATSLMAPKEARKSYEKAAKLAKSKKMPEAQKEYESATTLYPKYAAAWYELGLIHERENRIPQATEAYTKSMESDAKFIKPYLQMAGIYARENKWQQVADTTKTAIKLNPYDFPGAYFYHSVAMVNLHDLEAAEKAAREGLKMDSQNRIPKLAHVLGVVLAQKQDFSGAADNMKLYLKLVPNAPDADAVKKQLAEVEGNSSQASATKAAQQ